MNNEKSTNIARVRFSFGLAIDRLELTKSLSIEHLQKSVREEAKRITRRAQEAAEKKKTSKSSTSKSNNLEPGEPPRVTDSPEPLEVAEGESMTGGIWDLHGENPPPSSIAARKDTVCRSFL